MRLLRRQFLHLTTGAAILPFMSLIASGLDYPSQPVRLIVPYASGGTTDTVARLIGPGLSERLGQPFVVESRPGAGTNVGTEVVAHSPPDGYTLLLFDPAAAINATQFQFHSRHRSDHLHLPDTFRYRGQPSGSTPDAARIHRLCQSESGKDQHGVGWQRNFVATRGRAV